MICYDRHLPESIRTIEQDLQCILPEAITGIRTTVEYETFDHIGVFLSVKGNLKGLKKIE